MKQQVLFYERQFMPAWSLWLVAFVGLVIPGFILFTNPMPALMIFLLVILMIVFALFATMQTRVTEQHLLITFGLLPLIAFRYDLDDILSFEARTYHPMKEYGGWGIKGSKQNRALSMQGNEGVQLEMRSKEGGTWKLLIGSQVAEKLEATIRDAKQQQVSQISTT
ncbi:MAG TPA: hypothetical protein VFH43_04375 [Candidatus Kapabacteria bacterium]|nr:hypothetical protein [Candidatus Kapabacteria bacterium]